MDISVKRALLNKCLDTKLVSALRTHKDVTPTTEIDAPSARCLAKLPEIFLEKNPLWLRRHRYFQCTQVKSETVEEWWARKLDRARECRLNEITPDELPCWSSSEGLTLKIWGKNSLKKRAHFGRPSPNCQKLAKIRRCQQESRGHYRSTKSLKF